MNLRWDPRAVRDLHDIRRYIAAHSSPAAAERFRRHLSARTELLRRHPHMGPISSHPEIRILARTRYPYRIYYAVQGDEIAILHIRHTARRAPDDLQP